MIPDNGEKTNTKNKYWINLAFLWTLRTIKTVTIQCTLSYFPPLRTEDQYPYDFLNTFS